MARGSLAVRAGLAVTLMVMFYSLAAAAIAGLGWLGVTIGTTMASGGRASIMAVILALACLAVAAVIAWSVLPRWDNFEPPGVEVTAAEHPELFVEIERIAQSTGQRTPAHVYLVGDVNAFVAQRGGIMGIGSSRVMGIGLPLMRTLTVAELRAVLAHEMGHFYGGDTKLGPWIYKTRGALGRTVVNLHRASGVAQEIDLAGLVFWLVKAPFRWFLIGFMRISQAISRAQEYSADAVAVRAEGKQALVEGLKKTHAAAIAHHLYLRFDVAPLVDMGALPEVGAGFTTYLRSERMSQLLDEAVEHEISEGVKDPYDSHPPLGERIAAAQALDVPDRDPVDTRSAIELVRDPEAIECADIEKRAERSLNRFTWAQIGPIWANVWRHDVGEDKLKTALAGISSARFAVDPPSRRKYAAALIGEQRLEEIDPGDVQNVLVSSFGAALAVRLLDAGYTVDATPGAPFTFVRGDERIDLFGDLGKRFAGEMSAEDWFAWCEARGIAELMLVG